MTAKTDVTIRPYEQSDFDRLCEIHDAARRDELSYSNLDDAFIPMREAAENEGLFDYTLAVALKADGIVGFVAYCEDELAWLYVDPKFYRQGIARKLTQYVIEATEEPLSLEVLEGNDPAYRFYQKMGFEPVAREGGVMVGNEDFDVTVNVLQRPC